MTSIAGQRLIEASATLEPADRALLNLFVNHGLDDGAVARLTRASPAAIASQRESLVEHLSTALELPPAMVRDAVDELTTSARGQAATTAPSARDGNHVPDGPIAANAAGPRSAPSHAPGPSAAPAPAASPRARVSRRGAVGLAAATLAIVVALVVILAPGNAKHRATAARKLTTAAPTAQPAPPPAQPAPPPAQPAPPPAVRSQHGALAGLPGGPAGVTGSLTIVGPPTRSRLDLIVSGLPSPRRSHYELWLYNSIIDAVPLTRLGAPRANLGVPLPPGFRRYRWLDISLQPPRSAHHSGESIVRAALPG